MKYLRRFVWYLAGHLLVLVAVLSLMVVTFFYAMNFANVQVVLKDGMAMRAKVVMMDADASELTKYFQSSFLERDQVLLAESPYEDYNIVGIDHRMEMGFFWAWPWDETIRVDITERIPSIDGRIKSSKADAAIAERGESAIYPPDWQSARYRAVLVKENGQWKIKSLTLLEYLQESSQ